MQASHGMRRNLRKRVEAPTPIRKLQEARISIHFDTLFAPPSAKVELNTATWVRVTPADAWGPPPCHKPGETSMSIHSSHL